MSVLTHQNKQTPAEKNDKVVQAMRDWDKVIIVMVIVIILVIFIITMYNTISVTYSAQKPAAHTPAPPAPVPVPAPAPVPKVFACTYINYIYSSTLYLHMSVCDMLLCAVLY